MTESPPWIIVDDTSPEIHYHGDWFADTGTQGAGGPYGLPFQGTLHGTNTSTSLSFSFSGTAVVLNGAMLLQETTAGFDPSWECLIDGISIGSNSYLGVWPENNKNLCGPMPLLDGDHTLTVHITSRTNQSFWFDNIQFVPSLLFPMDNRWVRLMSTYPYFTYTGRWNYTHLNSVNEVAMTSQQGAKFEYIFEGTSLAWYGAFPKDLPGVPTSASYTVDENAPITFDLQRNSSDESTTLFHVKFFETSIYANNRHKLSVVYNGNSSTTPLVLHYLVIHNGESLNATSAPSVSIIPVSTAAPTTVTASNSAITHSSSQNIIAIAVGVVGGIFAIACVFAFALLYRRRGRDSVQGALTKGGTTDSDEKVVSNDPRTRHIVSRSNLSATVASTDNVASHKREQSSSSASDLESMYTSIPAR